MRALFNFLLPVEVDHSGVAHYNTTMLVCVLFYGFWVVAGLVALINRTTAARMAPCPDGLRRGLFTQVFGMLNLPEWRSFRRDLLRTYASELALISLLLLIPLTRDFICDNPGWVAFICLLFTPAALLGQLEERKTLAFIHQQKADALAAATTVATTAASVANTAVEAVADALRPASDQPLVN